MFSFFRRYQRALYFLVTAVIVFSFSFFGTYSAFVSNNAEDPVLFTTVDGKKIHRSEFSDIVRFLSSDSMLLSENNGEPANPLNDGVIARDIVETGLGTLLVKRFDKQLSTEFNQKLRREKAFRPYVHPQAGFLGARQVWSYFEPELNDALANLQALSTDQSLDIYEAKKRLFLAERRFPPMLLRQVLMHQQQQFGWIEPDMTLPSRSLSLFNYQQVHDWFGQLFLDKACEFIMQTAAYARSKGIEASSEEVMLSLYQNAKEALKRLPSEKSIQPQELLKRTMQEFGMDKARLVAVWRNVLLFRKALIDLKDDIIVNVEPLKSILKDKFQGRELSVYQLQAPLRFASQNDLCSFQLWLNAVSATPLDSLTLPATFKSPEKVLETFPQLVERDCILQYTETSLDDLIPSIRLKDIWTYQTDDAHYAVLEEEIPALKDLHRVSAEDRIEAIQHLSKQLKEKADQIATDAIIQAHPSWITEALQKSEPKTVQVGIRLQGGHLPFVGVEDVGALLNKLSQAPIGEQSPELAAYTQDGRHFYRITVLDMAQGNSLVPFDLLRKDGTLSALLTQVLELAYPKIRTTKPSSFKTEKGEWKPFAEVQEAVAEVYFASLFKNIDQQIAEYKVSYPKYCNFEDQKSARVSIRFFHHLLTLLDRLKRGEDTSLVITSPYTTSEHETSSSIIEGRPLSDLWLLVQASEAVTKDDLEKKPQFAGVFEYKIGDFIPPKYSKDLGPFFAKITRNYEGSYDEDLRNMTYESQKALGDEAIVQKGRELITEFFPKEKEA